MTQSSCKRDTKSKSHPSVKLAPVRVFSCKHPLKDSAVKAVKKDAKFKTYRCVKGVPFANGKYTKGVPFLPECYIKG